MLAPSMNARRTKAEQSKVFVELRLEPNSYGVPRYFMPALITFSTLALVEGVVVPELPELLPELFPELLPELFPELLEEPLLGVINLDEAYPCLPLEVLILYQPELLPRI